MSNVAVVSDRQTEKPRQIIDCYLEIVAGSDPEELATTIADLESLDHSVFDVRIWATEGADRSGGRVKHISQLASDHARQRRIQVFLRAGDVLTPAGHSAIVSLARRMHVPSLIAFAPIQDYVVIDQSPPGSRPSPFHDNSFWPATTGFATNLAISLVHENTPINDVTTSLSFLRCFERLGGYSRVSGGISLGHEPIDTAGSHPYMRDPKWYLQFAEGYIDLCGAARKKGRPLSQFTQRTFLYLLEGRLASNLNNHNKAHFHAEELTHFFERLAHALRGVDDQMLIRPRQQWERLSARMRLWLLELKHSSRGVQDRRYQTDVALTTSQVELARASSFAFEVELTTPYPGGVTVEGRYYFPIDDSARLVVRCGSTIYSAQRTLRQAPTQLFGRELFSGSTWKIDLPLPADAPAKFTFFLRQGVARVPLPLAFPRPRAHLSRRQGHYWHQGTHLLSASKFALKAIVATRASRLKAELNLLWNLAAKRTPETLEALKLRVLYWITRPYFRSKRVWLYYDKIYKAGDNGEVAFREAVSHAPKDVRPYYILQPTAADAKRFKKERLRYVPFASYRSKLLMMHAHLVFATHINPPSFIGFTKDVEVHVRDKFNYRLVCIQHGLTVQDISRFQNRVFDGTNYYCVASPVETANVLRPAYDYDKTQIVKTGLARFDGLSPRSERLILVAPTWRNYLAPPSQMGSRRAYDPGFVRSTYYRIFNGFLSNEALLNAAREHSYKITFLLHPVTSAQLPDFQGNSVVTIADPTQGADYNDLMSRARIMITDYSGIQFDFAYTGKQLIYFHPEELPASYGSSAFNYEKVGLGEVTTSVDELVAATVEAMTTDFATSERAGVRADTFFYHRDNMNAHRILQLGLKIDRPRSRDARRRNNRR